MGCKYISFMNWLVLCQGLQLQLILVTGKYITADNAVQRQYRPKVKASPN